MKIYIDGDGCPVVYETIETAMNYGIKTAIVCDTSHLFDLEDVEVILVDQGKDSADFKLLSMIEKGDIVVTQDNGLAALCLSKEAYVINQNGTRITNENILMILNQRSDHMKIRKKTKRFAHIAKRSNEQDQCFIDALDQLIGEILNDKR